MSGSFTPRKLQRSDITPLRVYLCLSFLCFAALLLIMGLSRGTYVERYFFWDTADTGMDFFHSIEYVQDKRPYQDFFTLYPPLANLLFYGIYQFMPPEVKVNWNSDFFHSLSMRRTHDDLRVHQAPMVMFILFVVIVASLVVTVIREYLKDKSPAEIRLLPFAVLTSYGMLRGFERGNIIMLGWILILCFLSGYESEKKVTKELSLIALALAFGIKLYPALFGLLLLQNKDFKAAIRTCIYGIASLVLPYLVLFEGTEGIRTWYKATTGYGADGAVKADALGNSMSNILATFKGATDLPISEAWFGPLTILACVVMILCSFFVVKKWKKVMAILLAMVLLSMQGEYIYMLFGIPMLMAFKDEDAFSKDNIVEYACMFLLMIPLPIFYKHGSFYPHNVMAQLCIVVLSVKIFIDAIIGAKERMNKEKKPELKKA